MLSVCLEGHRLFFHCAWVMASFSLPFSFFPFGSVFHMSSTCSFPALLQANSPGAVVPPPRTRTQSRRWCEPPSPCREADAPLLLFLLLMEAGTNFPPVADWGPKQLKQDFWTKRNQSYILLQPFPTCPWRVEREQLLQAFLFVSAVFKCVLSNMCFCCIYLFLSWNVSLSIYWNLSPLNALNNDPKILMLLIVQALKCTLILMTQCCFSAELSLPSCLFR